jgi:PKD repeat protein
MKDNNEARVTSEEATGSKFFTTITGDNINTPLVDLKSSDSNVGLGEEVVFTATAKDILGQDLTTKSKYSWDFDGDGFYDMETSEATAKYKFSKSGTFYSKVKVKYKGLSSTRNITLSVSNKLVADFEYISIGNKFIFFDTSLGQIDNYSWDL